MAFLGDLVLRLKAETADFTSAMSRSSYLAQKSFKDIEKAAGSLQGVLVQLGAGVSVGGFIALEKHTINVGDNFNKMSQKVDMSVESLSAMAYAAELSDLSLEGLQMGAKKLSTAMVEANSGGKEQVNLFKALGVGYKDVAGNLKAPDEMLLSIADKFAATKDSAEKSAIAVKLFGKSGLELIPFLNQGSAAIRQAMEEAKEFGVVWSKDAAKGAEDFNDNMKRLKAMTEGLSVSFVSNMLPALLRLQEEFIHSKKEAGSFFSEMQSIVNDRSKLEGWAETISVVFAHVADAIKNTWMVVAQAIESTMFVIVQAVTTTMKMYSMTPAGMIANKASGGGIDSLIAAGTSIQDTLNERMGARAAEWAKPTYAQTAQNWFDAYRKKSEQEQIYGGGPGGSVRPKGIIDTSGLKEGITKEQEIKIYTTALQGLEKQYFSLTRAGAEMTVDYETRKGSLRLLTEEHKKELIEIARKIDAYNRMREIGDAVHKQLESEASLDSQRNSLLREQNAAYAQALEDQNFEFLLIGKTSREAEIMNAQRRIELDLRRSLAALPKLEEGASARELEEDARQRKALTERAQEQAVAITEGLRLRQTAERDWVTGAQQAFVEYSDAAMNAAANAHTAFTNAFSKMEDALVEFSTTGKLNFKQLADSIVADITRMQIRANVTGPLADWMKNGASSGWLGKLFGGQGAGAGVGNTAFGSTSFADAFAGGVIPMASGGDFMVTQPTLFLAGEAGPERATFGGAGNNSSDEENAPKITVVMNISTPDAGSFRASRAQIAADMTTMLAAAMRRGG